MYRGFGSSTFLSRKSRLPSSRKILSVHDTNIPGLFIFKDFISPDLHDLIVRKANRDWKRMQNYIKDKEMQADKDRMHHMEVISYNPVKLVDDEGFGITARVYPTYGQPDRFHSVFIGYDHIPMYCINLLRDMKADVEEVRVMKHLDDLIWKVSLNIYDPTKAETAPIPFLKESEDAGDVAGVIALENPSLIQYMKAGQLRDAHPRDTGAYGPKPQDFLLQPRDMLVMMKEARYEWPYRMVTPPDASPLERMTIQLVVKEPVEQKRRR